MALVVESTSEAVEDPYDGSVIVTKPSGVAVGDLLVIVAVTIAEVPTTSVSGFNLSFAFGHDFGNSSRDAGFSFFWRIADASDVSASNYTVSNDAYAAYMFRISGWTAGEPVYRNSQLETSISTGNPTGISSGVIALDVPSEQVIIMGMANADEDYSSYSSPSVTPSNPTWTLMSNFDASNAGNTKFSSCMLAYATRSELTNITGFGFNMDLAGASTNSVVAFVACIVTPLGATGTNALLEVSPTIFTNAGVEVGGTGTNALLEVEPEIFDQSGRATTPTQWVNEDKPSTSWTNEPL